MIIDGAEVIVISKRGDFGVIKYTDNLIKPISVNYIAICQYENDKSVYLFQCNDKFEVEQDSVFDSVEEAKHYALEKSKNAIWENGIEFINFDDVDFCNGEYERIEIFGEDMLEIRYSNGYLIDVGFYEGTNSFIITLVKYNDWTNIINEFEAKSDIDLKRKLKDAIQWVKTHEK